MADHYYSSHPQSESQRKEITCLLREHHFQFTTDRGVFSRTQVDVGSQLLVETARVESGNRLLDLGCGYGVVGIALAFSVPDVELWAVDVNERAVELCRLNATRAHVPVRAFVGDGIAPLPDGCTFHRILLNPPIRAGKATVWRLYEEAASVLVDDGYLYVVIRKKQGAKSTERHLHTLFETVEIKARESGYYIYECVGVIR